MQHWSRIPTLQPPQPKPSEVVDPSTNKHLHGKYKAFFAPEHHEKVETWWTHKSTKRQRQLLKSTIKDILAFSVVEAKKGLRTTYDPDILGANSVLRANNGHLLTEEAALRSVEWLSFASTIQRNQFRDTFGAIAPPSMFTSTRQIDRDYVPSRKFMKSEASFDKGDHIKTVGEHHITKPSQPHEKECEIIARHPTHTGTYFTWKTGALRSANVIQRAHSATFAGAPWGVYGDSRDSNETMWTSQTKEDFANTFYLQDKDERKFQNYNENYMHMLYKSYKQEKKERNVVRKMKADGTWGKPVEEKPMKVPAPDVASLGCGKYIMETPLRNLRPQH